MSNLIYKIKKYFQNPAYGNFLILNKLGYYVNRDEQYLKALYKFYIGKPLDLNNPRSFNEKLQWLKLYDKNPKYTMLVDKYLVKKYVAEIIGEQYIIPTIGVWDSAYNIDFESLPKQFVLKCNHNSGGIFICKDKSNLTFEGIKNAKFQLQKQLEKDYFLNWREWPYKNVKRKILAEPYMEDKYSEELMDYKLMCFNGEVKCSFTCTERFSDDGLKVTFFDRDWHVMPFERHYPKSKKIIEKPYNYDLMITLAEKLSKDIPFVRVDFYEINGKVFFGELTFYPGSGIEEFVPEEWDYKLGEWIDLSLIK